MSHANNAFILLIVNAAVNLIGLVLDLIPVIAVIWGIVSAVISILCFVLMILGIVAAAQDKNGDTVAVIGQIKILK